MTSLKQKLLKNWRSGNIETIVLLTALLCCQAVASVFAYLVFATILLLCVRGHIFRERVTGLSAFSMLLIVFAGIYICRTLFSPIPHKSIQLIIDMVWIAMYFLVTNREGINSQTFFTLLCAVLTVLSTANVIFFFFHPHALSVSLFFQNPILQGIASGIAVIYVLYTMPKRHSAINMIALLLNGTGVLLSGSKSALFGVLLFSIWILIGTHKKRILFVIIPIALAIVIPGPINRIFQNSVHKAFTLTRVDIWRMSVRIFYDYPVLGIAPNLFRDTAKRYNFPQSAGLTRFGKLPESPHNDFLLVLCEVGCIGAIPFFLLLFLAVKHWIREKKNRVVFLILCYLIFQMCFFNFMFNIFFFFLILSILQILIGGRFRYYSIGMSAKIILAGSMLAIWIGFYLFPCLTDSYLAKALKDKNIVSTYQTLKYASQLNPLDANIAYQQAIVMFGFFKHTRQIDSWSAALERIKQAQKLNPLEIQYDYLETELFMALAVNGVAYDGLYHECVGPLMHAIKNEPFNPFLCMKKAHIAFLFSHTDDARQAAFQALQLEPEFVDALIFLHKNYGFLPDEKAFQSRIRAIDEKSLRLNLAQSSYAFQIFQHPAQ